jgi:hypothetical protein
MTDSVRSPYAAAGQRLWRDIATAPDNELIYVWDAGTVRQSMRVSGQWTSEWKNVPPPAHPTLWIPMMPVPDGAAV